MAKPKTFSEAYPITCTTRELFVRQALPNLPGPVAEAVRRWAEDHGLDVNQVVLGRPITRDPGKGTLTWWTRPKDSPESLQCIEQRIVEKGTTWPAPFPPVLLEQPVPSVCPTCGRDTKKPIPPRRPHEHEPEERTMSESEGGLRAAVEALIAKWDAKSVACKRGGNHRKGNDWRHRAAELHAVLHAAHPATVGDDEDVATGRCCPNCRTPLTEHNRKVWEAGYAVGTRHTEQTAQHELTKLLTPVEHGAIDMAGELMGLLSDIAADGPARAGDLAEVASHIHGIQRAVLKQAAARAYPDRYRLLGGWPAGQPQRPPVLPEPAPDPVIRQREA
jgi:uncharacterized Zn finger protein (UPF0148 family)